MHHSVSQTRGKITVMFMCCLWIPQTIRRLKVRCYSSQSANTLAIRENGAAHCFLRQKVYTCTRTSAVWALGSTGVHFTVSFFRIVIWLKKLYTRGPLVVEVYRESRPGWRGSGPCVSARCWTCSHRSTVRRVTDTRKPTGHSGWIKKRRQRLVYTV